MQTHTADRPTALPISILLVVAGAVLTALSAQIKIPLPFTPVPVTMQVTAVLLVGAYLGPRRGALSQTLYLGLGALGLPVFAASSPATVGYLLAFPLAAALAGLAVDRVKKPWLLGVVLFVVTLPILALGTLWLKLGLGLPLAAAFMQGFYPFLIGDVLKVALATLVIRTTRSSER